MTSETKWRAFNRQPLAEHQWAVELYTPKGRKRMVENLDEPTATQMVADHGKAALCEELADALRACLRNGLYEGDEFGLDGNLKLGTRQQNRAAEIVSQARTVILKFEAGRTPG